MNFPLPGCIANGQIDISVGLGLQCVAEWNPYFDGKIQLVNYYYYILLQ